MKTILCVCSMNTVRSVMLTAYLIKAIQEAGLKDQIRVESAGYDYDAEQGWPAEEGAALYLAGKGIDVSGHRSRHLDTVEPGKFSVIVPIGGMAETVLEDNYGRANIYILPGDKQIINPFDKGGAPNFDACAASIQAAIPHILAAVKRAP